MNVISREMFSLDGKTILVTGAGGHLGKALCAYLVRDGARVIAVDIDSRGLRALQQEVGPGSGSIVAVTADLADEHARVSLATTVGQETRHLDGAVFAAAFVGTSNLDGWAVGFQEQTLVSWRAALELNLTAPFHLTQLLANLLRSGTDPSIVNIGSIYGSNAPDWSLYDGLSMANPAGYGASKGGLVQLTRWLGSVLAPDIRVNMVSPGGIARDQPAEFVERYSRRSLLGRMATEEDVVGQIVNFLSRGSGYVTGQVVTVDGGFTA